MLVGERGWHRQYTRGSRPARSLRLQDSSRAPTRVRCHQCRGWRIPQEAQALPRTCVGHATLTLRSWRPLGDSHPGKLGRSYQGYRRVRDRVRRRKESDPSAGRVPPRWDLPGRQTADARTSLANPEPPTAPLSTLRVSRPRDMGWISSDFLLHVLRATLSGFARGTRGRQGVGRRRS